MVQARLVLAQYTYYVQHAGKLSQTKAKIQKPKPKQKAITTAKINCSIQNAATSANDLQQRSHRPTNHTFY